MPTSAPLGDLLPWEGGRIPLHRLPMKMVYNTRIPFPRIRHFERKREIFFVRGQGKGCERNGKREAPCSLRPEKRCFMQTAPRRKKNTANEKDPSAALGMTIRECRFPQRRCEITIISFSRSICREELAALIGVTGKPYPSCLSCHSHPIRPCGHLPLAGKAIKLRKSLAT